MTYTEQELEEQLNSKYLDHGIQDDLSKLSASILSKYLYLHQIQDISILLEQSFSRCKMLNSRIQHAADNFYSVNRGSNRLISLSELGCTERVEVKKFDLISTYGDFKLFYAQDYTHNNLGATFTFNAYFALSSGSEVFNGDGKLYHDVNSDNISEDIIVFDSEGKELTTTKYISDLYLTENAKDIAIITLPNYRVRLWKKNGFLPSETYTVKYLHSPDESINEIDLKSIKSLPGYIKSASTKVNEINSTVYKLSDNDKIYLYTINSLKFKDTMKSVNSLDVMIKENFPEFKGFKTVIDRSKIDVHYVIDYSTDIEISPNRVNAFNELARSYYITQQINFILAEEYLIEDYKIKISYSEELNFDVCNNIVNDYQSKVGEAFNPYQLIADLMSSDELIGRIKRVVIPADSIGIVQLNSNERVKFKNLTIDYESI